MPTTTWSTRKRMASTASIAAMITPPMAALTSPSQTLVAIVPTRAAPNAPIRNWPSIATFTTPDRSPSTPARAPRTSGRASSRRAAGGVHQRQELARHLPAQERQDEPDDADAEQGGLPSAGHPGQQTAPAADRHDAEQDRAELAVDGERGALGVLAEGEPGGLRRGQRTEDHRRDQADQHQRGAEPPLPVPEPRGAVTSVSSSTVAVDTWVTSPSPSRCRAARSGRRAGGRSPSPGRVRR